MVVALLLSLLACSPDEPDTGVPCDPVVEVPYDGVDQDCDGADVTDVDADGFDAVATDGPDCNDDDPAVNPDAEEICNEVDDDCDGLVDNAARPCVLDASSASTRIFGTGGGDVAIADLNLDGEPELAFGTQAPDAGVAVYLLDGGLEGDHTVDEAYATFLTTQDTTLAGDTLSAGRPFGDGSTGLLLGAPGDSTIAPGAGAAWLVPGDAEGPVYLVEGSATAFFGTASDANFGISLILADLNGDAVDDAVIGAPNPDYKEVEQGGAAYLFFGPLSGSYLTDAADVALVGSAAESLLGRSLATGDFDGDGIRDLVVGAPGFGEGASTGMVYLFNGPIQKSFRLEDAAANWRHGSDDTVGLGNSLVGSDLDGDGLDDLALAERPSLLSGRAANVYVSYAALSGGKVDEADAVLQGGELDDFGENLESADLDGDGIPELIVGAEFTNAPKGEGEEGAAYVYACPLLGTFTESMANLRIDGVAANGQFAQTIGTGDLDGDGSDDLALAGGGITYVFQSRFAWWTAP